MNNYNHKQFIDWLNGEMEKTKEQDNKLLIEAKLSKYWKRRAKRRALDAGRTWPNERDSDWASKQQDKSQAINDSVYKLFEKELEESEEALSEIDNVMKAIKKGRHAIKMKREAKKQSLDHPAVATKKRKGSESLSVPSHPEYGGVKKGFDKKRKQSKTVAIAGTGGFGPAGAMEESKEKNNENN